MILIVDSMNFKEMVGVPDEDDTYQALGNDSLRLRAHAHMYNVQVHKGLLKGTITSKSEFTIEVFNANYKFSLEPTSVIGSYAKD